VPTTVPDARSPCGRGLHVYLRQLRRATPLDARTELRLAAELASTGSADAFRRLVDGHLRTVLRLAFPLRHRGVELCELLQEGNVALLRAIRRYDPSRGTTLTAWVSSWIRTYLTRATEPSAPSAAAAAERVEDPERRIEQREAVRRAREIVPRFSAGLAHRERRIFASRVLGSGSSTLAQHARDLGISIERVRQIEVELKTLLRQEVLGPDEPSAVTPGRPPRATTVSAT
jgi:RNA polymerase sigma factor (sigma-70 family)